MAVSTASNWFWNWVIGQYSSPRLAHFETVVPSRFIEFN